MDAGGSGGGTVGCKDLISLAKKINTKKVIVMFADKIEFLVYRFCCHGGFIIG